jgi:pathogenesis-related protein 1
MRAMFLALWLVLLAGAEPGSERMHRDMLEAHNRVRSAVRVSPLTWSSELAATAQSWADQLLAEHRLRHHASPRYGENLYLISGASATPNDVVSAWASEAHEYDDATNSCHSRCGHYTQIVWRSTRQVGCARARSPSMEIWVCEYSPPGNYVGQRPY